MGMIIIVNTITETFYKIKQYTISKDITEEDPAIIAVILNRNNTILRY